MNGIVFDQKYQTLPYQSCHVQNIGETMGHSVMSPMQTTISHQQPSQAIPSTYAPVVMMPKQNLEQTYLGGQNKPIEPMIDNKVSPLLGLSTTCGCLKRSNILHIFA